MVCAYPVLSKVPASTCLCDKSGPLAAGVDATGAPTPMCLQLEGKKIKSAEIAENKCAQSKIRGRKEKREKEKEKIREREESEREIHTVIAAFFRRAKATNAR